MKKSISWIAFVFIAFVPLYATITIDLPYQNVSVFQNGRGNAEFGASQLSENAGQPSLPVYTCAILLPPSADLNSVSFSITGLKEELVGVFNVNPALPPYSINGVVWPENRSIVDGRDVGIYTRNQIYPQTHVEQNDLGYDYCYKIVQVTVYLARYNPVTQQLYQMKSGKLAVHYATDPGYRATRNASLLIPVTTKDHLRRLAVNYDEFIGDYESDYTYTRAIKMAIITSNAVKTGSTKLSAFIDSKKKRGIDVTLVTEDVWGGGTGDAGATKIRTWLQTNYQTLGLQYVLLIGGSAGDVPMLTFTGYATRANCPSDFPFAQLTGDYKADKLCEVSVGRFPVYSADYATLDAIMDKCITYESVKKADAAWRKNALFAGPGYASGQNLACVPLNAVYNDCVVKTPPWKAYRIYSNTYGTSTGQDETGTETQIIAKWNSSQFGLVDWATHGSPTSASGVMSSSGTAKITNGNKSPAYVFCGSCSNASVSAGNLSYSLLKNCALTAIGGTNLTYYGGSYLTSGSDNGWAYKFGKHLIADSLKIGDVLHALQELDPSYGWMNRGPYVLYGDPTLGIITCEGSDNTGSIGSQNPIVNTPMTITQTTTRLSINFKPTSLRSARLMIYNPAGVLINERSCSEVKNAISWNLDNKTGEKVGSGIYLMKLSRIQVDGSEVISSAKVVVK